MHIGMHLVFFGKSGVTLEHTLGGLMELSFNLDLFYAIHVIQEH
jgi:hypothetical protein